MMPGNRSREHRVGTSALFLVLAAAAACSPGTTGHAASGHGKAQPTATLTPEKFHGSCKKYGSVQFLIAQRIANYRYDWMNDLKRAYGGKYPPKSPNIPIATRMKTIAQMRAISLQLYNPKKRGGLFYVELLLDSQFGVIPYEQAGPYARLSTEIMNSITSFSSAIKAEVKRPGGGEKADLRAVHYMAGALWMVTHSLPCKIRI